MQLVSKVGPSQQVHRFKPQNSSRWFHPRQPFTQVVHWTCEINSEGGQPSSECRREAFSQRQDHHLKWNADRLRTERPIRCQDHEQNPSILDNPTVASMGSL
jgi:hypothetical protein